MNVYFSTDDNKRDIVIAWTVAVLIHVLFFSLTGKMFIRQAQFTVAPSRAIDINLIDVPQEESQVQRPQPVIKKIEKIIPKIVKPIVKPIEKPKQVEVPKQVVTPKQVMVPSAQVRVEAKPDYIQNPPPPYPELAKQMGQEGLVILSVEVDRTGEPLKVEIKQSSGYRLLDRAALKAVSNWKFQPGSIANIPIESTVTVPIRFRLDK